MTDGQIFHRRTLSVQVGMQYLKEAWSFQPDIYGLMSVSCMKDCSHRAAFLLNSLVFFFFLEDLRLLQSSLIPFLQLSALYVSCDIHLFWYTTTFLAFCPGFHSCMFLTFVICHDLNLYFKLQKLGYFRFWYRVISWN